MAPRSLDDNRFRSIERRLTALEGGGGLWQEDPTLALSRDLVDLGNVPMCAVTKTSDQTIVTATTTEVTFGNVLFDTDGLADPTNNGITLTRSGVYQVSCLNRWANNTTGLRWIRVVIDDSIWILGDSMGDAPGTSCRVSASKPVYLELGETLTVEIRQESGGNLDSMGRSATEHGPELSVVLLGDKD